MSLKIKFLKYFSLTFSFPANKAHELARFLYPQYNLKYLVIKTVLHFYGFLHNLTINT